MCGIAGFVTLQPYRGPDRVIRDMTDAIAHRGPDASGFYADQFASLGHRRLSIVDLSTGQQPMFDESGNLCVIYNGEIFNHADLRPALEQAGHHYSTRSDTETILHAYEQYGRECVTKFRGMFAFAVWDAAARTLFCARDRLGIKPFYYYWDGQTFAFASEIKALLRHPCISARFEESRLSEYLAFGYSSSDVTMFAGIRKLMPGHRLVLTPAGLTIDRFWQIPEHGAAGQRSDDEWIRECRQRLEETVRMRLMSDVPLGMFLSGGVDSSAIAALMARMVSGPVKSFSVGYREAPYSELGYASQVAQAIGTDHHEVLIGKEDFFGALPRLIWHEDEPIVWPSSVSLYFVSKLAAEQVKVVLTGEGADELFGGYGRYRFFLQQQGLMHAYSYAPSAFRGWLRTKLSETRLLSPGLRRKVQHTVVGHEPGVESFYLDNFYSAFSGEERRELLPTHAGPDDAFSDFLRLYESRPGDTLLRRLLYADQHTYLVELLMKQDQMSMACSIESRVPFLDHPFVEFAAQVPDHLKIRGREGKYILKRAVEDLLPHGIVYRKKMGFPTPLRDWLRDSTSNRMIEQLRNRNGFLAEYLNMDAVDTVLARHASGEIDATDRIWRLLNLHLWGQIHLLGQSDLIGSDEIVVDQN